MKSLPITISILFFLVVGCYAESMADQWELEMEREGIRVYTQIENTSPYKQVKVTATIDAPIETVMAILMEFGNYKNWMNNVDESYLINQQDSAYYVFLLEDVAWPVQNRYQVSKINVKQSYSRAQLIFNSVSNYIEKRADAIQIKQFEGYWNLTDQSGQQCALEYVVIHNPGGYVPPWLTNMHAIENPFENVMRLKQLAENTSIRP